MKEVAFELNGITVYNDVDCLQTYEQLIDLPLSARLLSWPWKPWKKTYSVKVTIADPLLYQIYNDENKVVGLAGHPDTVKRLSHAILEKISNNTQKM